MNDLFIRFSELLQKEDKDACLELVLQQMNTGTLSIVDLYETVIKPSMNQMYCSHNEKDYCIWQEHARSAIIRTIIECCYPFVLEEKKKNLSKTEKSTVAILCPDGELHELGARMASDYFMLWGFKVLFIGSSTPASEFIKVIQYIQPDYVAISVTNYYNLVSAKKTIEEVRRSAAKPVKIIAGGQAFHDKASLYQQIGADILVNTYEDIGNIRR